MTKRRTQRRDPDGIVTGLIYTRVSSDEQAREGLSLPAQLQASRRYCADRGWIIGGEYQDIMSGTRDDRIGYQSLLTEARRLTREGRRVAVVVMRLDRFGRRLMERVNVRAEFKKAGVVTHSVKEGEVNDLMANMLAVMAQEEVDRLGDRVRDIREHVASNGWHVPGRAAWGYRLRTATDAERAAGAPKSVLIPDEATAPYVREMFRRVARGEATPRGVALWVVGLPDDARGEVSTYVRRTNGSKGCESHPRIMNPSAVRMALMSPVYIGRFEDGSTGRWEPLIDVKTWDAVRAVMASRKRRTGPVSGHHLLTGLLRCPRCGGKMAGWLQGGKWKRYRCSSFVLGGEQTKRDCMATASASGLDDDVIAQTAAVLALLADGDLKLRAAIGRAWERLRKPDDAATRERKRRIAKATKDVSDAKRRIGEATRLLVDGTIDRVAYKALSAAEQARLDDAERVLAAPEVAIATVCLPPLSDVVAALGGWRAVLTVGPTPEQRDVLMQLVASVTPVRLSYGKYRAEIVWTPVGEALRAAAA